MSQEKFVRELITPEGVDLRLTLADGGERVSAFLLDVVFIVGGLVGLTLGLIGLAFLFSFRSAESTKHSVKAIRTNADLRERRSR